MKSKTISKYVMRKVIKFLKTLKYHIDDGFGFS